MRPSRVSLGRLPEGTVGGLLGLPQQLASCRRQPRAVDAVMPGDLLLASRHGMVIKKTDDYKSARDVFLEQQASAGFSQTTVHAVLLNGDHSPRFGGGVSHRRLV